MKRLIEKETFTCTKEQSYPTGKRVYHLPLLIESLLFQNFLKCIIAIKLQTLNLLKYKLMLEIINKLKRVLARLEDGYNPSTWEIEQIIDELEKQILSNNFVRCLGCEYIACENHKYCLKNEI